MKTLTFKKQGVNLGQLHGELMALIPSCRPVVSPTGSEPGELEARCLVEGRPDGFLRITVSDSVDAAQVSAVVSSHVADPSYGREPPITEDDLIQMDAVALRRFLARRLLPA